MKRASFLKSVAVITFGGLAAKGIGALYRIPLMSLLGGYGMGLYQRAYPLFCLLLTFSSAGIPSAFARVIAKETASGAEDGATVKTALKLFSLLGLAGSVLMCLFAPYMAELQGDGKLLPCYLALAPSVFLVAVIAVLRGYFQGKNNMVPTAASEVVEQAIKAAAGVLFALRYRETPEQADAFTLLTVTISEAVAVCYLLLCYRGEGKRRFLRARTPSGAELFFAAFPVMAAAALLPLSQTVDSVLVVRLLARHTSRAVALYGLFTGGAIALMSLPATVCYGVAAASVPAVSASFARGDEEGGRRRAVYALALTLLFALPCAAGLFFFARPLSSLLFPSLREEDCATLVRLIRLTAISAATLAGINTLAACLTGMGRAKYAAFSMLAAVLVKFAVQIALVPDPAFSIAGAAIAANICYLIAFSLDLVYTVKKGRKRDDYDSGAWRREGRFHEEGAHRAESGGYGSGAHSRARSCGGA